jgi:hypothetical protein
MFSSFVLREFLRGTVAIIGAALIKEGFQSTDSTLIAPLTGAIFIVGHIFVHVDSKTGRVYFHFLPFGRKTHSDN